MIRHCLITLVLLAAGATVPIRAQDDAAPAASATLEPITDIEWRYAPRSRDDEGRPFVRFSREGSNSTMGTDDLPEVEAALLAVLPIGAQAGMTFVVVREAGRLTCTGRVTDRDHAAGTCRFDPDGAFAQALAARGLVPEDNEEMLGLTFVDAKLASIDEMSRAGFEIADVDELMAVSALEVTSDYAVELRGAGLEPGSIDNLVAGKAVGVDAAWVAEMAEAGFARLDMDKAIEMRALGITPDYARRMARVVRASEGVE